MSITVICALVVTGCAAFIVGFYVGMTLDILRR